MAKIKGIWLLNGTLSSSINGLSQVVNFTSNNIAFDIMLLLGDYQSAMTYGNIESTYSVYTHSGGWINPAFRVVDFGSIEQEVADAWYTAFTKNAKQASTEEDDEEPEAGDVLLGIWKSTLDGIADAVREKTGKTAEILGSDIENEIRSISGSGGGGGGGATAIISDLHSITIHNATVTKDGENTITIGG